MIDETPIVKKLARHLCELSRDDPDRLEPGNVCFHSSFDPALFREAEYDHLFDNDPAYAPDGHNGKDKCMFAWRGKVQDAVYILELLKIDREP